MRSAVLFPLIVSVLDMVKNCHAQKRSVALPFWVNEAVFGPAQNAFENVNRGGNGVYALLWATYNNDPAALGHHFKCVIAYNTKRNALDHTLRSHFKFRNDKSGTTYIKTRIKVTAVKHFGYRHYRNALQLVKGASTLNGRRVHGLKNVAYWPSSNSSVQCLPPPPGNNSASEGLTFHLRSYSTIELAPGPTKFLLEHHITPKFIVSEIIKTKKATLKRALNFVSDTFVCDRDGKKYTNILIFSNGRYCDVFLVPKHKNGCELWVREDWLRKLPLCCVFLYQMCALGKPTYKIYTPEECDRKQAPGLRQE